MEFFQIGWKWSNVLKFGNQKWIFGPNLAYYNFQSIQQVIIRLLQRFVWEDFLIFQKIKFKKIFNFYH